jgi:hypothetical protein
VEPVEDCVPRTTGRATATEDDNDDPQVRLADFTPSLSTPTPEFRPTAVPSFILEHPAIRAVLSTPADAREAWCDVHRPRTAAAVLGNELEATYLRDWLSALSVGSREARRVVRRVPRRRRENDSDWIVDDTGGLYGGLEGEEFAGELDGEVEVPEPADEPVFPLGGRPDTYPPIEYWIGNALLLSGPTGSGKTAAVHAAAAELGWDVFEVYPGIGRRSGANLLALVGEVGKNHMVVDKKGDAKKEEREKETEKAKTAAAKASFFGAARVKEKGKVSGSQEAPIELDEPEAEVQPQPVPVEVEARKPAEEPETPAPAATKQSLILIDEADILFEEESTFWPAIVKLIADSHRPVVITCNGELGRSLHQANGQTSFASRATRSRSIRRCTSSRSRRTSPNHTSRPLRSTMA